MGKKRIGIGILKNIYISWLYSNEDAMLNHLVTSKEECNLALCTLIFLPIIMNVG